MSEAERVQEEREEVREIITKWIKMDKNTYATSKFTSMYIKCHNMAGYNSIKYHDYVCNLQTGDVGILSLKANCFSLLFLLLITFASITMESINIPTMINSDTPHAKPVITFPETE